MLKFNSASHTNACPFLRCSYQNLIAIKSGALKISSKAKLEPSSVAVT